jgi:hypothetical protein
MRVMRCLFAALLAGTLGVRAGNTGTDPAHKYAWGENVGWVNAVGLRVEGLCIRHL